ncbi:MAG: transglutaminase domain-containing protein [Armatimonadetes bacterium]|nr:transglutaminase domain-containing protein [Armatimonadota bacterium]
MQRMRRAPWVDGPADPAMYVAVVPVVLSPALCASDRLGEVPGLLPFLLGLMLCGVPVSLWLRRRGVERRWLSDGVTLCAIGLGVVSILLTGNPMTEFRPEHFLDSNIDGLAMSYLIRGITWIVAFRCLALVSDLDLLLAIGFSMSLFLVIAIVEPEERTLGWLLPFLGGSIYLAMRHRRHVLERGAELVVGPPARQDWRGDAGTLFAMTGVMVISAVVLSVLLADLRLPTSMVQSTGVRLAQELSHWIERAYTGGAAGLESEMDVGGRGPGGSEAVVFEAATQRPGLWRGNVFRYYDGRSWRATGEGRLKIQRRRRGDWWLMPDHDGPLLRHVVTVQRTTEVLYAPPGAVRVQLVGYDLEANTAGRLRADPPLRPGTRYVVYTANHLPTPDTALPASVRARYLAVPRTVPRRVLDRSRRITRHGRSDEEQMNALCGWLAANKQYTLRPADVPDEADAVDWFLEHMDAGWCRHFAAALAVMGRAVGVPTRVVTGYVVNERSGDATVARDRDAHAWVEAWLAGRGWVTYDATALASERQGGLELTFAVARERWLKLRADLDKGRYVPVSSALSLVLCLAWLGGLARREIDLRAEARHRAGADPAALRLRRALRRALRPAGLQPRADETDPALAARAESLLAPAAGALHRLGDAISSGCFSGRELSAEQRAEAAVALGDVRRAVAAWRKVARRRQGS